jgi:hypothetical protein
MLGIVAKVWNHADRRYFIGGSDGPIIIGEEAALVRPCREQRTAEPEELSSRPTQPCDHAGANPFASVVGAAHAEFVGAMAGSPPRPIPVSADAIDLEDRAEHLNKVLGALSVYVAVILDDTAQNVPGGLDLRDAEAALANLASDLSGAIQRAADQMAGRVA